MSGDDRQALAVATETALAAGARFRAELHRPGGPRGAGDKSPEDAEAALMLALHAGRIAASPGGAR